jgi:hypothetical protein
MKRTTLHIMVENMGEHGGAKKLMKIDVRMCGLA